MPGGSDPADIFRDQYNNEVGRLIAQYAKLNDLYPEDLDDLIIDALTYGSLITDLNDPRIANEDIPTWSSPSPFWEGASQGRDYSGLPEPATDFILPLIMDKLLPDWLSPVDGPFSDAEPASSPLIIDLDNDGVEATTFNTSTTTTFFDIDNDGFHEQTAWVGADDGLLVRDLNANGQIDDAPELFGSATADGFAILSALDSNSDHVIDANDADFSDLMIWKDVNEDAYVQTGELQSLSYWNIQSISLAGITASTSTINGTL